MNSQANKNYRRGVAAYFCHSSCSRYVIDIVEKMENHILEGWQPAPVDCGVVVSDVLQNEYGTGCRGGFRYDQCNSDMAS